MKILIPFYLIAFISANLIVKHFGAHGLWFSSFFLIPFDFVARCVLHETYKGSKLIFLISFLTAAAAVATVVINSDATNIAEGSVVGFIFSQILSGIFYQLTIKKDTFIKVNGSDAVGIIFDSIVFQLIAFGLIEWQVTAGQILIKILGGFLWYIILFKWLKVIKPKNIIQKKRYPSAI